MTLSCPTKEKRPRRAVSLLRKLLRDSVRAGITRQPACWSRAFRGYEPICPNDHAGSRAWRGAQLKRTLDAFTVGNLAHDERAVEALVALGDHHAFVSLNALALAFNDVDVDDDGIAGGEGGNGLVQAGDFFLFERCDQGLGGAATCGF